jgi:hypothetical protein
MRKKMKDVPLFPLIPLVPAALLVGSLVTSIRALTCVRRLERQLGERAPTV